ncbi:MAG: hypothetical protein KJO79_10620 [Verrucomicrobiae bacterium]|nr:hypothetical protein [Verrucomicrobiae bacterium]
MKSPVKSHLPLEPVTLDDALTAFRCPETGGHWIPLENYWDWKSTHPDGTSENDPSPEPPSGEFDDCVKLCPVTGTIMTRYRVGVDIDFRVDRSITGGIWLDGGEWEVLQAGNLHRELHRIFTAPWQKAVRTLEQAAHYDTMLETHLGEDLYKRLSSLREDLREHPARGEALAFLQNKN